MVIHVVVTVTAGIPIEKNWVCKLDLDVGIPMAKQLLVDIVRCDSHSLQPVPVGC